MSAKLLRAAGTCNRSSPSESDFATESNKTQVSHYTHFTSQGSTPPAQRKSGPLLDCGPEPLPGTGAGEAEGKASFHNLHQVVGQQRFEPGSQLDRLPSLALAQHQEGWICRLDDHVSSQLDQRSPKQKDKRVSVLGGKSQDFGDLLFRESLRPSGSPTAGQPAPLRPPYPRSIDIPAK